jgi:hypothetical protein
VKHWILGIAVTAMLALPIGGWAEPSLVGPTGLVTVPTAGVLGMGQWNVGATGVRVDEGEDESIFYGNVGLLPRLELGFARDKLQGSEAETLLSGKVQLLGPLPGRITLSAGMIDITDQIDRSGYVVASHTLGAGVLTPRGQFSAPQVHLGVGSGGLDGLFGGLSVTVNGRTDVMAEYDGEDVNVGVRWPVVSNVGVSIALLDGLEDLAAGLSFSSPW